MHFFWTPVKPVPHEVFQICPSTFFSKHKWYPAVVFLWASAIWWVRFLGLTQSFWHQKMTPHTGLPTGPAGRVGFAVIY